MKLFPILRLHTKCNKYLFYMKGFYFINTDIGNTRAHTCQMLNTISAIDMNIPIDFVAPKYHNNIDLDAIKIRHNTPKTPRGVFLRNFGIKKPRALAFALFNAPAILFLLKIKIKKTANFIYIRSSLFMPIVIFAYLLRVPIFYETHRRPMSFSERLFDYLISKMATGIIVISNYMKRYYLSYKKEILVAHDAVSLKRFDSKIDKNEARKKFGIDLNKRICVYAGTISKLKGSDYIFEAARVLPNVDFLLVGHISQEFKNIDLPANVKLLGKKEQKELPLILKIADALLLPHPKGEYSQSPMKLFEYMASKCPIVASDLPSIREILNENNAVLVKPEDVVELVEGIKKVLRDKNLSDEISKQAFNDVKNYTWEKRGKKIAEFIKSIK